MKTSRRYCRSCSEYTLHVLRARSFYDDFGLSTLIVLTCCTALPIVLMYRIGEQWEWWGEVPRCSKCGSKNRR